jgi:predicted nuclease with TOPRIM domain
MENFNSIIYTVIASIATGLGGWLFGRRKNNADARLVEAQAKLEETRAQTQQIENLGKAVDIWKEAAENLNAQLKIYVEEMQRLKLENNEIKVKFEELNVALNKVQCENGRLKKEIEKLKNPGND